MMKKLLILLFLNSLNISAQCDIPQPWNSNTGVNMTLMLLPDFVSSLPVTDVDAYLVALTPSGLVVGSTSVDGINQTSMAIWGDDTFSPEIDGALSGESITFQLVNGEYLYDISPIFGFGSNSYVSNSVNTLISGEASILCSPPGCTDESASNYDPLANEDDDSCEYLCTDPNYLEYYYAGTEGCISLFSDGGISSDMFSAPANTGANMTIGVNTPEMDVFEGGLIGAFYDLNGDGTLQCVGLETIYTGFMGLALWGDDSSTPEQDGLYSGSSPQFAILYDGMVLAINESPEFTGYVTNGIVNLTSIEFLDPTGCTDPSACNFDQSASVDDGSCYNNDLGCGCDNPAAEQGYDCAGNCLDTDADGVCDFDEIPGCTDPVYVEFDLLATDDDGSCELLVSDLVFSYDSLDNAYQILLATPQCEEIVIDIQEGWNLFGYTSSQAVDITDVMAPFDDYIYIIKDNNGSQYWPANDFNGIGDFVPGGGYQIKAYQAFSISFEN